MELEAIRFFGYPSTNPPGLVTLEFESADDLRQIRDSTRLGVLLLRNRDIEKLCEYRDAVWDRGKKHPSKGLPGYLLDNRKSSADTRMRLIRCEFQEPGRAKLSIQSLLEQAAGRSERHVYLIGIPSDTFDELKHKFERVRGGLSARPLAAHSEVNSDRPWPEEVLALLHREKVPVEVSSRYLGTSKDVQLVHQLILRASKLFQPVLIVGESGTGKELIAWSIHEQSERRTGPFRAVNCGAIPSELFESELFGTTKSAFTGAAEKEGLWRQAHLGTLFLDEIGDLAPDHQVKILRAMQEGTIRRVGSLEEERVDARIIAATNRNLAALVQAGQFREDLFYRIHGFVIYAPALRSHPEDIPQMAVRFWASITRNSSKTLSREVLDDLKGRRWLGNGRELKMFLSSLYGLFGDQAISLRHLRAVDGRPGLRTPRGSKSDAAQELNLRRMDQLRHHRKILEVLSSLKTSLRPILDESATDLRATTLARVVLQTYIEKLESQADQPEYFRSSSTRRMVTELGDALRDFSKVLESNAPGARKHWETHVEPRFKNADSACFTDIQKLLDGVEK